MKGFGRKLVLLLSILGSACFIFIMAFLFVYALKYFRNNFPIGYPRDTIAFYVGIFVAITTVIFQWIDGRIRSIIDSINMLRNKGGIPKWEKKKKK